MAFACWKTLKRHFITVIILFITFLLLAFEFAVPFIFRGMFCPTNTTEEVCTNGMFYLHMCPFFIVSSLTLLALIIGLCQKVVGIILDIIAALLHVGVLVYYILFVIKGSQYTVAMAGSSSLILQIVPCVALALCTIACFVCMFDCCRHVYATRFSGSGSKGVSGTGDSSTDYVPLQGSKHIDSDSDDSD
ncbi:hypothetical protein C9374_012838 [Naegleria lovaniensis]|uniref:Uncharacterized protein n=1 Tax=Naegleria lovaniensis TaxID=51637 RepID=A0AA88GAU2_NAELO|nr:uncharacterized protein C9374_012838 [Naegleria lovaniensis]KAG2373106.1 hypothetical protein C9374_012838 [Naegleria lovaniensis]